MLTKMTTNEKTDGASLWVEILLSGLLAKWVQATMMPDAYLLLIWPITYLLVYFTVGKFVIRKYLTRKI